MWKRLVPGLLLVWFLVQTARALFDHSYVGFFLIGNANSATQLLMLDLLLALGLISIWMVRDARGKKGSYLPFLAVTLLFGVAGPLLYLVTRGWSRNLQRATALSLVALLSFTAGSVWTYADLRTPELDPPSATAAQEGRDLLQRAARRHGLERWQRYTTMEVTATDTFIQGGWWPSPHQRFRSQALLGTFTSRVELLDGPGAGEVRGIQSWAPYRRKPGDDRDTFLDSPAPEITFYLPTLQYFNELPFRLLSAELVLNAGRAEHRGRTYDRVFVTWGSPEPNAEHDQYLVWIDEETELVEMVHYTVRDLLPMSTGTTRKLMKKLGTGTIHFDDYRAIGGVMVPFSQTVTLTEPALTQYPLSENYLHRLQVEDARFDSVPRETLIPAPELGAPADSKSVNVTS